MNTGNVNTFFHIMTTINKVGGGYVFWSCLRVGQQDYCKSNQPILLKLDGMIGHTNLKN